MKWEPELLCGDTVACAWAFAWVCLCLCSFGSFTAPFTCYVDNVDIFCRCCSRFHSASLYILFWPLPIVCGLMLVSFLIVPTMRRRHEIHQMKRPGTLLQQTQMETEIRLRTSQVLLRFQFLYELYMTMKARSRMSWASKQVHEHQGENAENLVEVFLNYIEDYIFVTIKLELYIFTGFHGVCSRFGTNRA